MRLLLDARPLQERSSVRGIGTYVRSLLAAYATEGLAGDVGLLGARGRTLPADVVASGYAVTATVPVLRRRFQPLADPLLVARAVGAAGPDLYHATEYGQPWRARCRVVVTVHDLIPFVMPELYPWMRRERLLGLRLLRRADAVIADSTATADDVARLAHVPRERLHTVLLGVDAPPRRDEDDLSATAARLRLPPRFLLAVGTFDPRKRPEAIAAVLARVRRDHDVVLVVAGEQGVYGPPLVAELERRGVAGHARLLGHVTAADLDALFRLAACHVLTSAYEGFGLTPLEAMARGTPVVSFENSSLAEVGVDATIRVVDGDADAMAGAVSRVLGDAAVAGHLATAGRARAAQLTWARTATATRAVYERALGRG